MLVRSGLINPQRYLKVLAKTLTRVQRGSGRLHQSVTDSSLDAWHKFYKQDENAPNAIVSYYSKGALIALCLDSLMRRCSANQVTLDHLMQKLWRLWLGGQRGIAEREPQAIVSTLLGDAVCESELSDFFDAALYGTDELPLAESLKQLGVSLVWRTRASSTDLGALLSGDTLAKEDSVSHSPWLGANTIDAAGGVKIKQVINSSPAERAGLSAGDVLIAMDGFSVNQKSISSHLARFETKGHIDIHYFRYGQLFESTLPIEAPPVDTATLQVHDEKLLSQWLDGSEVRPA